MFVAEDRTVLDLSRESDVNAFAAWIEEREAVMAERAEWDPTAPVRIPRAAVTTEEPGLTDQLAAMLEAMSGVTFDPITHRIAGR